MIALLMGLGLAKRVAQVVAYVAVPLLVLLALYLTLDASGDSRFRAGRAQENAAWKAAEDKLLRRAATATTEADRNALAQTVEHAAKVEEEKEKVDDAIANGSSPFDVLFGSDGVQAGQGR